MLEKMLNIEQKYLLGKIHKNQAGKKKTQKCVKTNALVGT